MDFEALDILSADVDDELHVGHEILRRREVRDRLDDAVVHVEGVFDDVLTVACDCGGHDIEIGIDRINLLEERLDDFDGVALGGKILREQQLAVGIEHHALDRSGAGVHADVGFALVALQLLLLYVRLGVTRLKRRVVLFGFKKRRLEREVARAAVVLDAVDHVVKIDRLIGAECRAAGDVIERIFGTDARRAERAVKTAAQLAHKGERSAEVDNLSLDLSALRQSRDGLTDDRLENALRDVALARSLIQERLYIGFREHAAARRDRVGLFVLLREVVQLLERDVEQRRHLVDERARTACAGAVHAYLETVREKQNFRVLTAKLDDNVGTGNKGVRRDARRVHLLHKVDAAILRHAHACGTRKRNKRLLRSFDFTAHTAEQLRYFFGYLRIVALICTVNQLVFVVEHNALDRR